MLNFICDDEEDEDEVETNEFSTLVTVDSLRLSLAK